MKTIVNAVHRMTSTMIGPAAAALRACALVLPIFALAVNAVDRAEATPVYGAQAFANLSVSCVGQHVPADGSFLDLRNTASIADTISGTCGSATAQSSANTAGFLKAYGSVTGGSSTGASVGAEMATGVTLFAPAGFSGSTVQVTEQLFVSGTASGSYNGNVYLAMGSVTNKFFFASKEKFGLFGTGPNQSPDPNFVVSITADVPVDANGQAYFVLEQSLAVGMIPACLGCTSTVNLSHTARAAQILPSGWTFASDSGDFLVPEPETYAMMLAGFGVLGFVAQRSKKAAA